MGNVLILGASRGIGLELVRQHRAAGDRVVATARDEAGLARLATEGAVAHRAELATAEGCAALAWPLDGERFDTIWLVAGVYGPHSKPPEAPTEAEFDHVMHTNVLAAMRLADTLDPLLKGEAPGGTRIGILSSRMGSIGLRTSSAGWLYRASKAALNSVAKDLALLWGPRATVLVFHPGWVQTDMGGSGADLTPERSAADLRRTLAAAPADGSGRFVNHDGGALAW